MAEDSRVGRSVGVEIMLCRADSLNVFWIVRAPQHALVCLGRLAPFPAGMRRPQMGRAVGHPGRPFRMPCCAIRRRAGIVKNNHAARRLNMPAKFSQ